MSGAEAGVSSLDVAGLDVPRALIAVRDAYRLLAAGDCLEVMADSALEVDQAIASYFEKRRRFYDLERLESGRVRIRIPHPA